MINVAVICFTKAGLAQATRLIALTNDDYSFELYAKYRDFDEKANPAVKWVSDELSDWTSAMQKKRYGILFIGAMGIAVRAIASGVENKLSDGPVVVMDELGVHIIPVLSGHVGGANQLSVYLADKLGATPVITTATDLEGSFSVDLFAKENNLFITNKEKIAPVSAKALTGKPVRLSIENYPPEGDADVIVSSDKELKGACDLLLCPKSYAVGIGCKKDTSFEALKVFLLEQLYNNQVDINEVGAFGSINLKENEPGLVELSRYFRIPFITYTPELLNQAHGEFHESDFVKEKTGVGNVCERAAMLLTGNKGKIIQKKVAKEGMTLAIARMK